MEVEELHPSGDPGKWFTEDSADGVADVYATRNTVCGVHDGIIFESTDEVAGSGVVQGVALDTATPQWNIFNVTCTERAVPGDEIVVFSHSAATQAEKHAMIANIYSGKSLREFSLENRNFSGSLITKIDDIHIIALDDDYLGL